MKFGFVTCVKLGMSCMEEIYRAGGKLDVAVTLNDEIGRKKSGRVYLDKFCERHDLDLLKCKNINQSATISEIRKYDLDWLFIIGWSQIASAEILRIPRKGALGMHPSLLPVGRGRAAIPWAIIKGLPKTGLTLFKLDEGVDTGPIVLQKRIPISPVETSAQLYRKVDRAHIALISEVWPMLLADDLELVPQDESKATVWQGRTPADGEINLAMSADDVSALVRATTKPYPGAFIDANGKRYRIWSGFAEDGSIRGSKVLVESETRLLLPLSDGLYVADRFDVLDLAEG